MRIAVACDHGGFVQKDAIVEHLKSLGHEVFDLGTNSEDSTERGRRRRQGPRHE